MITDTLRYGASSPFERTGEPLLWYAGAGHELRTGPHYFHDASGRHDPQHMVLQLTLRGCGFYRRKSAHPASDTLTLLTPNIAFLDFIPGPFEYGWAGDAAGADGVYEQIFISMQGDAARSLVQHIHRVHGPILDFGADLSVAETMKEVVEYVHREWSAERGATDVHAMAGPVGRSGAVSGGGEDDRGGGGTATRYWVSGRLFALFMQILAVLSRSRESSAPLVSRAIRLIESHAHEPAYNVARLAHTLDCSREHLAREFRRATGFSPLEYLTRRRVRLAAGELRSDRVKLDSLAPRCGFTSAAYLCRVFRKVAGVTPQQYRERPWIVLP